jgi:hypothetical protein
VTSFVGAATLSPAAFDAGPVVFEGMRQGLHQLHGMVRTSQEVLMAAESRERPVMLGNLQVRLRDPSSIERAVEQMIRSVPPANSRFVC